MGESSEPSRNRSYDPATLRFYAEEAPAYVARGRGDNPHLAAFLDRLQPGARILELGCGGGEDSAAMLARGFDVDPTDAVAELVARAEARHGHPVRLMRFDQLDAVEAYDAVWAQACLLHVPRAALPDVLACVHRALRTGGWLFASYKSGETEGRDTFGRYFNYPSRAGLAALYAAAAPWRSVEMTEGIGSGYDRQPTPWIAVTASK